MKTKGVGYLILRLVVGGLMAGHGAQKLFGWFGGYGIKGTAGWLESTGLKPGKFWAMAAALSEFGGGLSTALGFLSPLGAIGILSSMAMAWQKAHRGKPIWVTAGGAELPLVNSAVALAIMLEGPGKYSLDKTFGIKLPSFLVFFAGLLAGLTFTFGATRQPEPPAPQLESEVEEALQGGEEAEPALAQS